MTNQIFIRKNKTFWDSFKKGKKVNCYKDAYLKKYYNHNKV